MDKFDWKNVILLRIGLFYEKISVLMRMISGTRGIQIQGGQKGGHRGIYFLRTGVSLAL